MYVKVYNLVPLQAGLAPAVITGVSVLPHASVTVGDVGAIASAGQLTVDAPFAGNVNAGIVMV